MSSCDLAESIDNEWKQQSGDRGSDLYVATVDDFVRSFMQSIAYYQYLKGNRAGIGHSKEELKLRVAHKPAERTRNSKSLHEELAFSKDAWSRGIMHTNATIPR